MHPFTPFYFTGLRQARPIAAAVALLLLAACGGGGDSPAPSAATGTGTGSTTGGTTATNTVTARLSGVAALGAPMAGARLQVVDATGTLVGTTTTNAADGSFALTLQPATGPLLLQAVGTDAAGQPLVLHGAVPVLSSAVVANITPLSDAILAVALGAEPRTVFATATAKTAALQSLASLTAASDFIKSLVKTNLSDAKTGDAKKLDLLNDGSFSAAKVGVDLALETLIVGYGVGSKGGVQLQLSNKLSGVPAEVTVDLETAKTELAKTTGGAPATAITSTLKATTSPTTLMVTLGMLDDLVAAINKAIAEGGAADSAAVTALLSKYTQHSGNTADIVATRIADWAAKKMQLGRLQVTGCADETIAKTGCSRVLVAARVNDAAGEQADSFADAVSYDVKANPKCAATCCAPAAWAAASSARWRTGAALRAALRPPARWTRRRGSAARRPACWRSASAWATPRPHRRRPPDTDFIGVEVHEPGVGALLKLIGERGLTTCASCSTTRWRCCSRWWRRPRWPACTCSFPTPGTRSAPQAAPDPAALRGAAGQPAGARRLLHCATDWEPYAEQMLQVLSAEPLLVNTADGYAPRPDYRPLTKFENRGLRLGHGVWDLVFRRSS
jgi:hypothetical protein